MAGNCSAWCNVWSYANCPQQVGFHLVIQLATNHHGKRPCFADLKGLCGNAQILGFAGASIVVAVWGVTWYLDADLRALCPRNNSGNVVWCWKADLRIRWRRNNSGNVVGCWNADLRIRWRRNSSGNVVGCWSADLRILLPRSSSGNVVGCRNADLRIRWRRKSRGNVVL